MKLANSAMDSVWDWWRTVRCRWQRLHELDSLSADEIGRMAVDVGLSEVDFLRLAVRPNGSAALLDRRLAALHLSSDEIQIVAPMLLRDMERTCGMCAEQRHCGHLFEAGAEHARWDEFCPNSSSLQSLR